MSVTKQQVAALYAAVFNRAPDQAGLDYWEGSDSFAVMAAGFVEHPVFVAEYGDLDNQAFVKAIYENVLLGQGDAEGIEFWVGALDAGLSRGEFLASFIDAALNYDGDDADALLRQQALENKVTVGLYYTETLGEATNFPADADIGSADIVNSPVYQKAAAAIENVTAAPETVEAAKAAIDREAEGNEPEGNTYWLTPNADRGADFVGTENDDTFEAPMGTLNFVNGNTLNTGDVLDGGAGNDTLVADLINDSFITGLPWGGAVMPTTSNIENVIVNAIDGSNLGGESTVVLNAARMLDVENVWSRDSNADLVIQDITTKTSAGGVRNTEALTFRMDHTSNANSVGHASDLTVYFDENYLLAGQQSEFSIQLRIVNNFQLAENDEPLSGFQTVNFAVGDQQVVVDITDATTYQQVADAINAELSAQGISGVHAALAPERTSIFSDDVPAGAGYKQGQLAGVYSPVNIVSTTEPLSNGPIELESNIENFDGLNTWVDGDSSITNDPITTNLELHKVGRGHEGGDIYIGGKAGGSIAQFNVDVLGADEKPSDIGWLSTGQNQSGMQQVNIATHSDYVDGETHASLTIRNGFGDGEGEEQENLLNVDANAFLGDLTIGSNNRVENVRDFTATGGGNVTYTSQVGETEGLESLGNLAYNIDTGGGSDTIDTNVFGGAQLILDSGAGDDTIDVVLDGDTLSGSTLSFADITSMSGNNTVTVSQPLNDGSSYTLQHEAKITTGAGVDTINGNGVSITVSTGGGNDVIYAENTGDKAITEGWIYNQSTNDLSGSNSSDYAVEDFKLLAGREIRVTVAIPGNVDEFVNGFESVVTVAGQRGTLSSLADYNAAVQKAINEHPVLKHIARAEVDSNGEIVVRYLVDGAFDIGNPEAVQVEVLGEITVGGDADDVLSNNQRESLLKALQAEYSDSGITEASLVTAFNAVADVTANAGTLTLGEDSTTVGANVINAGTGNDVIVLSSADADSSDDRFDIVEFDAGNFGNDTIVHFQSGVEGDVLDFAWLDMTYSFSGSTGSTSMRDSGVVFTNAVGAINLDNSNTALNAKNAVSVIDFDLLDTTGVSVDDFDALLSLGSSNLATVINTTFTTNATNFASKHIFLIQNNVGTNVGTTNEGNLGQYAVVQAQTSATSSDLTNVSIVGTLDFGVEQNFQIDNFFIA